jgi:hypothetical protein
MADNLSQTIDSRMAGVRFGGSTMTGFFPRLRHFSSETT